MKSKINNFKKRAKELGYKIKHSHVLEIFAAMEGFKDYNQYSANQKLSELTEEGLKIKDLSHLLWDNSLLNNVNKNKALDSYFNKLKSGELLNRFCYGIPKDTMKFSKVDPLKLPGAYFMGENTLGKFEAMIFSLMTHMLSNSQNSLYFLVSTKKRFKDYISLGGNVVEKSSIESISKTIDLVYQEFLARKKEFSQENVQVSNIREYEEKTNNKLSRIVLCFDEIGDILNSLNITEDAFYEENTLANKLKTINRMGRSYGIVFLATGKDISDIPTTFKPGFSFILDFKSNKKDKSFGHLGDGYDSHLEGYFYYFPIFTSSFLKMLNKKIKKVEKGFFLINRIDNYHQN